MYTTETLLKRVHMKTCLKIKTHSIQYEHSRTCGDFQDFANCQRMLYTQLAWGNHSIISAMGTGKEL